MEAVKTDYTVARRARDAKLATKHKKATPQSVGSSLWSFVNSVASGVKDYLTHGVDVFANAVAAHSDVLKWLIPIQWRAIHALAVWVLNDVERRINGLIARQVGALRAWTWAQLKDLAYIIAVAISTLRAQLTMRINAEVKARVKAVARAEAEARTEIRRLHQQVEREAASGYASGVKGHLTAVGLLGDAISAAEPEMKHLVGRIVGYAVDLAEIDNPLIRFLAGKLIGYLITKLGINKIAGDMLGRLVDPVTHMGAPKGLPEVITMVCGRINALEHFSATFMADGGPEVLAAGKDWRDLDTVVASVGIVALFSAMVAEPNAWAKVISSTVGVVVNDTITAASDLLGG